MPAINIHITGIVQGVGFRPFAYNLAQHFSLTGWVKNSASGVEIIAEGEAEALDGFVAHLQVETPPLAVIDTFSVEAVSAAGYSQFAIIRSEASEGQFQPIPPDVSICPDCLREMNEPSDRRYRYPFINCTNCGPRFTIIKDIPYDRPATTMAAFEMCPECRAEYENPANRRFHAQPVACPTCGPRIWLEQPSQGAAQYFILGDDALLRAQSLLAEGKILAIKGLGGFHLACDALNVRAVDELRRRKRRVEKPFALMMPDVPTIERHCFVSPEERALLQSPARPIVLLRRRPESRVALDVAPGQQTLGVMLPYTPLHYLLFDGKPHQALVMTSGNLSDEPICTDNIEARERLAALADAFLMHDREIHIRVDDSVMRVVEGPDSPIYPLRRSRGYAPYPVHLPWKIPPVLAVGAELKNTFCVTHDDYAFLSQHIGDLENYEALKAFEEGVAHFEKLFRVRPAALACDLHPNYLATRYAHQRAKRESLPIFEIQHHHAHLAALMAEQGLDGSRPVLGVAFDGSGYGEDGALWGGEFLLADYAGFQRLAHLNYFPLPGGDLATRRPARIALGLLHALGLDWDEALPPHADLCYEDRTAILSQIEHKINTPLTSSIGRLFDAAAALSGVKQQINYEAQAAMEFEALADPDEDGLYPFEIGAQINPKPAIEALVADVRAGTSASTISARFHNGLARMVLESCRKLGDDLDVSEVALSGGVWQNMFLLRKTLALLEKNGFTVYLHHHVPANDGGLALGQAVVAGKKLLEAEK